MKQVRFTFRVSSDNIRDVRLKPTDFNVVANLLELSPGIKPLIQILFDEVNILDILNVIDMWSVKCDCEIAAEKMFIEKGLLTNANVINSVHQLQTQK